MYSYESRGISRLALAAFPPSLRIIYEPFYEQLSPKSLINSTSCLASFLKAKQRGFLFTVHSPVSSRALILSVLILAVWVSVQPKKKKKNKLETLAKTRAFANAIPGLQRGKKKHGKRVSDKSNKVGKQVAISIIESSTERDPSFSTDTDGTANANAQNRSM